MDIRVLRVRRESRDRWDALAIQGQPVRRGRGDSREFQARQDHGDRQELRARSAPKVRREFLGIRGQLAPWVRRGREDLPGQPVRQGRKVQWEIREFRGLWVQPVQPEQLALLGSQV